MIGRVLFWLSVALGAVSAVGSVYFGYEVVTHWLRRRPAPTFTKVDHPIDAVAAGVEIGAAVISNIGDGITRGLFTASLAGLALAIGLYYLSRRWP